MDSILRKEPEKQHPVLAYETCEGLYAATSKELDGQTIAGPFNIYSVETIRKNLELGKYPSVPTDVFVWGEGEPEKPYLTKIGSLPYLPKDVPWPKDTDGQPYIFVMQICFIDSKDTIPVAVPGDVLLMFVKHDGWDGIDLLCYEPENLYFKWIQISDQPTWDQQSMMENGVRSVEPSFFGVIHRMNDYQQSSDNERILYTDAKDLTVSGTKIGGIPAYIQNGPPPWDDDAYMYYNEKRTWDDATYICQFVSLGFEANTPFPVCNRKKPFSNESTSKDYAWSKGRYLLIGDMGNIYFFMKPDGTIVWLEECY